MIDEKLERLKSLLKSLHDESEELLLKNNVWSSYGWQDQNTPDPEYVGIAMWELNPPFEHDWDHHLEGRKPKFMPTSRDEALLKNGEDLIATMAFARRSLGVALCYGVAADPLSIEDNEEFWQEYATTMMWLNIASECLRDFF